MQIRNIWPCCMQINNLFYIYQYPSKHKTFVWPLYKVVPTSSTLVQHCTNAIHMFCVYWYSGDGGGGVFYFYPSFEPLICPSRHISLLTHLRERLSLVSSAFRASAARFPFRGSETPTIVPKRSQNEVTAYLSIAQLLYFDFTLTYLS